MCIRDRYLVVYEMAKPQIDANIKRKANGGKGGRKKITNGFSENKPLVTPEENHRLCESETLSLIHISCVPAPFLTRSAAGVSPPSVPRVSILYCQGGRASGGAGRAIRIALLLKFYIFYHRPRSSFFSRL